MMACMAGHSSLGEIRASFLTLGPPIAVWYPWRSTEGADAIEIRVIEKFAGATGVSQNVSCQWSTRGGDCDKFSPSGFFFTRPIEEDARQGHRNVGYNVGCRGDRNELIRSLGRQEVAPMPPVNPIPNDHSSVASHLDAMF
jgi:hypothetical protein